MFQLDPFSKILTVDSDLSYQQIENKLNESQLSLGFFSPGIEEMSLEEVLRKNPYNLYGNFCEELKDLVLAIDFEDSSQHFYQTHLAPKHATGPSFKNFLLGSDHDWAVICRASLRVFDLQETLAYSLIYFSTIEERIAFERILIAKEIKFYAFNRFHQNEMMPPYKKKQHEYALLLEWRGFESLYEAATQQIDKICGQLHPHIVHENLNAKNKLYSLLRSKELEKPLGFHSIHPSTANLAKWLKQTQEHLCQKI